jgi:Tfp pilus assembly protein PilV
MNRLPRFQYGMSLIGLLIGLLISMLCILASLSLYKTLIHVAAESKIDSNHDGQLAAASLVMQMEVQSAGYGIANANTNDIVVNVPAAGEKRLLWRYSTDNGATFLCRGLHEYSETANSQTYRVLRVIKVSAGCNGTAALTSFTWNTQLSVLGRWIVVNNGVTASGLPQYLTDNSTLFGFTLATASCSPYGVSGTTAVNHLQLTVTAPGAARLAGATGVTLNTYHYCLANTYPT